MIAQANVTDNPQLLQELATQLLAYLQQAAHQSTAAHHVEHAIWQRVLAIGHAALAQFFTLHGTGDQGPTLTLPEGTVLQRLDQLHHRRYVSVFGSFQLPRTVYGSREGQKLDFVPLDNRLQLPASDFSYLLQDWDQALCSEQAFGRAPPPSPASWACANPATAWSA